MFHVLMIAERWGENTGIGSLRPMKITKYLLKMGCSVTVVCGSYAASAKNPGRELEELRRQEGYRELAIFNNSGIFKWEDRWRAKWMEYRISKSEKRFQQKISNMASDPGQSGLKESILLLIKRAIFFVDRNIYMYFKRINAAKCAFTELKHRMAVSPDLIISSYEPLQVHLLAMKLKKAYPGVRWIADFRDPLPNFADCQFIYFMKQKLQKYICRKADAVTIVSQGWRNEMRRTGVRNVTTIYSGFDYDDITDEADVDEHEKLTFVYTGSLYPEQYSLRPFAEALKELIDEKAVNPDKIKIIYAGGYNMEFLSQMDLLGQCVELDIRGQVGRDEALALQQKSDILLLAAYNGKKSRGHITGKMTEYWLTKKPIITIMKSNVPNTELKWLIERSNTGCVYEMASGTADMAVLKAYIKEKYNEKATHGRVTGNADGEFLDRFSYDKIAARFLRIGGIIS